MHWYSVRAVYLHGVDDDGLSVFEERVMLFRTPDVAAALALAEDESLDYLAINPGFQRVGEWAAFSLHHTVNSLHGVEAWSVLSEANAPPDDYYRNRYRDYELRPSDEGDQRSED